MPGIQLQTVTRVWTAGYTENADATLASAPTTSMPNESGIVQATNYNLAKVVFHGTTAADLTSTAYIYRWGAVGGLYVPEFVAKLNLTTGTTVGVADTAVDAGEYFVDTIDFVDGDESVKITTGIANKIASVTFDLEGCLRWQVSFDDIGGSGEAASMNYLHAQY
ncbi:MAG: hypothetical protein CL902_03305 [Dehalococcoidia bacterium]|nr:hypothetical protein [Dehalococcoidia bacterium]